MANQTDQLNPHMRLDGVFEGGAVKGIALIGALDVIEQEIGRAHV